MNDWRDVFAYGAWRFDMWLKGYGTYLEIDKLVAAGDLIPLENYPEKEKEEK